MKKAPVHGSVTQLAQCPAVRKRKDGLTAEFRGNAIQASGDFIESFIPGDALEVGPYGGCTLVRGFRRDAFRCNSSHRIQHPVRGINTIEIFCDLGAQKSAGYGMCGVPLDIHRPSVIDGDQYTTSVRAVVRTRGMDYLLHDF